MSHDEGQERSLRDFEAELKGKTLKVYWYILAQGSPVGVREIQRALGFSSPSVAYHHLEKLMSLHIVEKDQYGRYYLAKRIEVGVLQAFTRVGRFMLPRFTFYSAFFSSLFIIYILLHIEDLNLFAVSFALTAAASSWYETLRVWRRRPF